VYYNSDCKTEVARRQRVPPKK